MTSHAARPHHRSALAPLWLGLALTTLATAYAVLDHATTGVLADHVRAGYPHYDAGEIDSAVLSYVAILSAVGVLGIAGWLATIWAARSGKGWAPWLATGMLTAALVIVATGLTVTDTSGDVGLAPQMGWLQLVPCLPGAAAVAVLWKRRA